MRNGWLNLSDCGHQLLARERLRDQRVCAKSVRYFETKSSVHPFPATGDRDDPGSWNRLLTCIDQIQAVAVGHQYVGDNDIESMRFQEPACLVAA